MSYLGTTIFACFPTQAYFVELSPGTCINEFYAITTLSSLNTFSEAVMAALPIPVLFQLRMKSSQRWEISACVPSIRSLFRHAGKALRTFPEEVNRSLTRRTPHLTPHGRPDSESSRQNLDPKLSIYATQAELQLCRSVDVEGIGLDGFGYTVTITAGEPAKKHSLRKRKSAAPANADDAEKGRENWQMHRIPSSQATGAIMVSQRKSLEVTEVFEETVRPDRTVRGWDRFVL
ncbi:hypothetical protein BLS_004651 [Venturia inaequalis]|uniref:Rhodopsin domain-containing protein n=1 Tax=Venturia inaequalis TaxID=5025 RepID=A0A8H3YV44_VENIN|nr:hypothetical protein BLS_004651 [Venturia inaequalis]